MSVFAAIPGRYVGVSWYGTGFVGTHGVVVGRVIEVRPHPHGDHIWLADLDIGTDYKPQIVWGGVKVVKAGSLVPVAPPGSRLPGGKIRRRKYRQELSEGMLCSLAELGWDPVACDRVALLKPSGNLQPGDSLDDRSADWKSIVLSARLPRNVQVRMHQGLHTRIAWAPIIRSWEPASRSASAASSRLLAALSAARRPWR
jgi:tRNA-binding EMAP/Myf-like protein